MFNQFQAQAKKKRTQVEIMWLILAPPERDLKKNWIKVISYIPQTIEDLGEYG